MPSELELQQLREDNTRLLKQVRKNRKTSEFWQGIGIVLLILCPNIVVTVTILSDFFLRANGNEGIDSTMGTSIIQNAGSVSLAVSTSVISFFGGTKFGEYKTKDKLNRNEGNNPRVSDL